MHLTLDAVGVNPVRVFVIVVLPIRILDVGVLVIPGENLPVRVLVTGIRTFAIPAGTPPVPVGVLGTRTLVVSIGVQGGCRSHSFDRCTFITVRYFSPA